MLISYGDLNTRKAGFLIFYFFNIQYNSSCPLIFRTRKRYIINFLKFFYYLLGKVKIFMINACSCTYQQELRVRNFINPIMLFFIISSDKIRKPFEIVCINKIDSSIFKFSPYRFFIRSCPKSNPSSFFMGPLNHSFELGFLFV